MSDIHKLKFELPRLWEHDWERMAADSNGAEKLLLSIEGQAAHLLKFMSDDVANFERLAWLGIWSKSFCILEGARGALGQRSQYTVELLSRAVFEMVLHAFTIHEIEPIKRLRAYAAWCLWNDHHFQMKFLDPSTLSRIWNPHPAVDIAKDAESRRVYEELFGPLDIETDPKELHRGRVDQFREEKLRLDRLAAWLSDPDVCPWVERLSNLSKRRGRAPIPFFALFNETEGSVARRLESLDMGFLYLAYVKGSMFVHGSTLDHMYLTQERCLTPLFTGNRENVEAQAEQIGHACNIVLVLLKSIRSRLWQH